MDSLVVPANTRLNREAVMSPTVSLSRLGLSQDTWALSQEGAAIARYLVGSAPPAPILERYVQAHTALFPDVPSPSDRSLVVFIRRHPWALPYLDGAMGLLRPHGLLRNKILLMLALLETTPEFADLFFPERASPGSALARIPGCGLRAAVSALVGLVLYPFAVRTR